MGKKYRLAAWLALHLLCLLFYGYGDQRNELT